MKEDKAITLVSLVITIAVLIILASIATYSGVNVIRQSKLNKFTTEMGIMQTEINNLYDRYSNGTEEEKNEIINYGKELDSEANNVFTVNASEITDSSGYRYYDMETIESLGIENIEEEFYVNIEKRSVISRLGIEYEGEKYYTLSQLPNGLYNVEYENKNTGKPIFNVDYEVIGENKYKVIISDIEYSGYIKKWNIKYQEKGSDYWNTTEDLSFVIDEDGDYNIIIENGEVTSEIKTIHLGYITDSLIAHYDGINNRGNGHSDTANVWKDISGNNNDMTLQGFDEKSGWIQDGIELDGVDDYLIGKNPLYDKSRLDVTVEVISEKRTSQYGAVVDFSSIINQSNNDLLLWSTELDDGTNRCYGVYMYPGIGYNISPEKLNLNQLNSITYGSSSQNMQSFIYLNGEEENKQNITKETNISGSGNNELYFGRDWLSANEATEEVIEGLHYYFAGKIKSVRIYGKGLSQEEIENNYKIDNYRYKIE